MRAISEMSSNSWLALLIFVTCHATRWRYSINQRGSVRVCIRLISFKLYTLKTGASIIAEAPSNEWTFKMEISAAMGWVSQAGTCVEKPMGHPQLLQGKSIVADRKTILLQPLFKTIHQNLAFSFRLKVEVPALKLITNSEKIKTWGLPHFAFGG